MWRRTVGWVCVMAVVLLVQSPRAGAQVTSPAPTAPAPTAPGKTQAAQNVIPVFQLRGEITESPADPTLALFGPPGISLRQLVEQMKQAAADESVRAVVLLDEGGSLGIAQIEEIRQAIKQLRDAGKDVYVHADSLTLGKYALFCGATRLSVVPTGDLWITGIFVEQPFVRGLLNKISVTPDFMTCGEYKSAAEIFMREGPSPQAEEMTNWLLDGVYATLIELIARGRNVSPEQVKTWIDNGPYSAEKARGLGMIDAVEHRQQFQEMLKSKYGSDVTFEKKYGQKKKPQMDLSSPFAIFKMWGEAMSAARKGKAAKDAVGVVYVEGPIVLGSRDPSPLSAADRVATSTEIRKALDEAANDDSIKAVVLRINSPGGSAVASEIILDGTRRVKARKPLVVSMGNVAGSGGYYVACGSDIIFADSSTITGSIGVVAGKLVTTEMWRKVGVTWKSYARGRHAGILATAAPFSDEERQKIQSWMNEIYEVFKGHVREIRGSRLKKNLEDLAGGRVYTGQQALELGLVDKIGTLQDAIAYAAGQASIKDYDVRVVPEPKNFIEQLIAELTGAENDDSRGLLRAGNFGVRTPSLWDLALPHLAGMDPQRIAAVREAFVQMTTLQDEGVVLMMPPMVVED
ncbi:signal peptide peptidase SppA [Fontivita pretiosa]|uniref:signal peptide peptidase SppA n=1 Tax=Fontivita pretiosa TaxID=2989684 RepID=UPI003D1654F6